MSFPKRYGFRRGGPAAPAHAPRLTTPKQPDRLNRVQRPVKVKLRAAVRVMSVTSLIWVGDIIYCGALNCKAFFQAGREREKEK